MMIAALAEAAHVVRARRLASLAAQPLTALRDALSMPTRAGHSAARRHALGSRWPAIMALWASRRGALCEQTGDAAYLARAEA
jgi:uncharacterized protein YyaL (SSP411 family)